MFEFEIDIKFDKLTRLPANLRREVPKVLRRNAEECGAFAKSIAAVDTGEMRDSIEAEPDGLDAWVVGPHTDHDLFIELGTSKMPAQPFLTPATERQRPRFFGDMDGIVERAASG